MADNPLRLDEIGYWSEVKLEIVRKYAAAYSRILSRQASIKAHVHIDAFAGAGSHISKASKEVVAGSPVNALHIDPPFSELHFIDLKGGRAAELRRQAAGDARVTVHQGDCNKVLIDQVFPRCKWADFRRALCLLDPYGLNVNWEVLSTAGSMKSIEIFYNFMIMDANMNVFMRDPGKVTSAQVGRMDAVWGDGSWKAAAYTMTPDLFGHTEEKATNEDIAEAFRERLEKVAGFAFVPAPMPMRNSRGAVVYYLYFASQNSTGAKIVNEIFATYRSRGAV